jgi:hypothetical protein
LPQSGTRGPWGGFWLHSTGDHEIDVLEPDGCDTEKGTQFHSGSFKPETYPAPEENNAKIYGGFPDLSMNWNKYALIWTPKYIKVLFNDNLLWEIDDIEFVPFNPMFLFLTFQIDKYAPCTPTNNGTFPTLVWRFRKFKYYRLKTDCSVAVGPVFNFDFSTHDYKVHKSYTIYNSVVPSSSNIVLRATDYIELSNFTVPLGSTFTAITHFETCPD